MTKETTEAESSTEVGGPVEPLVMRAVEKYTNDSGKECYRGVTEDTPFSELEFHEVDMTAMPENIQFALHTNLGSLTVLDRLTGYSGYVRDTETGYRDQEGHFWLASCMVDVRNSGAATIGEAIEYVKRNANTCVPQLSA